MIHILMTASSSEGPLFLDEEQRGYAYDCFSCAYGYVHIARMCSHIAAVVLHRMRMRLRM